jgi:hypothetical protein
MQKSTSPDFIGIAMTVPFSWFAIYYSGFTVYRFPFTLYSSLFTIHHLLFTVLSQLRFFTPMGSEKAFFLHSQNPQITKQDSGSPFEKQDLTSPPPV